MTIGYLEVQLRLPACQSLKDKRSVVKKTIAAVRNRHNVSIAEIDGSNLWKKAVLGISCVSNDRRLVGKMFQKVVEDLEARRDIELVDYFMEML